MFDFIYPINVSMGKKNKVVKLTDRKIGYIIRAKKEMREHQ